MPSPKKPAKPKLLQFEDFRPAEFFGITFPQLALYIEPDRRALAEGIPDYQFKPGRVWHKLAHVTGGVACNERYLIMTPLAAKSLGKSMAFEVLARKWFETNIQLGVSLDCALEYRHDLQLIDADCNRSYADLEEGICPIDPSFWSALTSEVLPKDLDDLIIWENGYQRFAGIDRRWKLALLTQNSD